MIILPEWYELCIAFALIFYPFLLPYAVKSSDFESRDCRFTKKPLVFGVCVFDKGYWLQ